MISRHNVPLRKFSLVTAEVCETLQKLTSAKCKWIWNSTHQNLYDKTKKIMKKNVTMAFYNQKQQSHLEKDPV